MGFVPDRPSDAFWFVVAPVTAVPTAIYGAAGLATGDYPLGKPDWAANARNSLLWTGVAGSVYGWNYFMSPQNAVWMTGGDAYKMAGYLGGVPLAFVLVATAAAVGYVATADVHGGTLASAPGGVGPTHALGFEQGVRDLFGWLGF